MNAAQIHLALNHAPLFFSLAGGIILLVGLVRKNSFVQQLSFYFLIAGALCAIPVFLTGEGTEELVEKMPGVAENAIGEHEDWAKITLTIISAMGLLSLAGIFTRNRSSLNRGIMLMTLFFSLASFGAMAQTAHLGGLIRHTELQQGGAGANEGKNSEEEDEKENKKGNQPSITQPTDSLPAPQQDIRKKDDDD